MVKFNYKNPTKLIFGQDRLAELATELSIFGKKVLLVYGGGSVKKTGLYDRIIEVLKDFEIFELNGVEPNPRVTTAQRGANLIKDNQIDAILAVGGGSVIDCTKLISVAAHYSGDAWDIVTGKHIPTKATPFGTVLTLSATGSEMNSGSVITNTQTLEKRGWGSPLVYPTFSLLDPTLTYTLPTNQTVNGIVDMMSHLIEQYFNEAENTVVMDRMIEGVLKSIISVAPILLTEPKNYNARETIMLAGTIALNGSLRWGYNGDWSSHQIEHALSAYYDIAHAEGLAIVMPNWMRYTYQNHLLRFAQFARNVFGITETDDTTAAKLGIEALSDFWKSLGAPNSLKDKNIDSTHFEEMAKHATPFGTVGGLQKLNKDDVLNILQLSK